LVEKPAIRLKKELDINDFAFSNTLIDIPIKTN